MSKTLIYTLRFSIALGQQTQRMLRCLVLLFSGCWISGCASDQAYFESIVLDQSPREAGISMTWLGTAGVMIDDGSAKILIDPFVSRRGLDTFSIALNRKIVPDPNAIDAWSNRIGADDVNAILVSHSHYDHSIDAIYFQRRSNAQLYGSLSTSRLPGAKRITPGPILVEIGKPYEVGDFTITFFQGAHGRHPILGVRYPGTIEKPLPNFSRPDAYKKGQIYTILIEHELGNILHVGSSGWQPGALDDIDQTVDIALLAASNAPDAEEYVVNTAGSLDANLIIPIHFDNFFAELDGTVRFQPFLNLKAFAKSAAKAVGHDNIRTLPIGTPVSVLPR